MGDSAYPPKAEKQNLIYKCNKDTEINLMRVKELRELVDDMYWEYDRMSSSGQETLDKIADLLGIPTESEMNEETTNG